MLEYELDIPSLTDEGIQLNESFINVIELNSLSIFDKLIMIKMLILLQNTYDRTKIKDKLLEKSRIVPSVFV